MSRLVLTTGGGRSGKSAYAQAMAEALPGPRAFVATCPVIDDEMRHRIAKHRRDRAGKDWTTIEEPEDLVAAIRSAAGHGVVLVDCLTLWVNNLMYAAELRGERLTEAMVAARCRDVLAAAREHGGTVVFVTNEVGMGIVPEHAGARHFRDLAGRVNQVIAADCDEVFLLVCGQPLRIKGGEPVSKPSAS
ncbi:MAG: bifunctional adenosylcobinamide kinase/adenosylcobinamide-phosphate guanylyltransferase [Verrucomicrobiales bacterium]|nr:bifunctional adenosylcobinamide kinase/adenosylcobinamide-phosphate guanylyltransferase [Verrucomicrobiota bacterium JB025]